MAIELGKRGFAFVTEPVVMFEARGAYQVSAAIREALCVAFEHSVRVTVTISGKDYLINPDLIQLSIQEQHK